MPSQSASVHQDLGELASFIAKNQLSKPHAVGVKEQDDRSLGIVDEIMVKAA